MSFIITPLKMLDGFVIALQLHQSQAKEKVSFDQVLIHV